MSNSNNIDEASRISEPILNDAPPQKILNDIIPYLRASAESEGDMQSPYGPVIINSEQKITAFVDSHIGGRKENQDSAGFKDTALGAVIVVCDGMGGMNGGQKASSLAVTTILDTVAAASLEADRKEVLAEAIKNANAAILAYGAEYPSYAGMGTTVTALIVSDHSAVVAYVGDSRIYQLRNGKKVFRTFDHSMVFEMVKRKALTEEQARLSAQSNVILKALGVSQSVDPDVFELPYRNGDRFILCSDGFWGTMPEEAFLSEASSNGDTDKVLADMMRKVDEIGNNSGGKHDNLTAAFVDMQQDSKLKEKMNKTAKIIIAALTACLLVSLVFNIIPDEPADQQDAAKTAALVQPAEEEETNIADKYKAFAFGYAMSKENTYQKDDVRYAKIYMVKIDMTGKIAILEYTRGEDDNRRVEMPESALSKLTEDKFNRSVEGIHKAYYAEIDMNYFAVVVMEDGNMELWISNSAPMPLKVTELNNNN